jgi:hypothetical protein
MDSLLIRRAWPKKLLNFTNDGKKIALSDLILAMPVVGLNIVKKKGKQIKYMIMMHGVTLFFQLIVRMNIFLIS